MSDLPGDKGRSGGTAASPAGAESTSTWKPGRSTILSALILVGAVAAAYWPALGGGFVWDDDAWLTENPLLSTPKGLLRIWAFGAPSQYFPMVYTTFFVERALWGLDPLAYHATNVALHIINSLLVWRVLHRLEVPGAWFAAMIFGLHPVHVESVAWITERKNVLVMFFSAVSLLAWIRYIDPAETRASRRSRFYLLSLGLFGLALLSKTTACTLPAALVLTPWLKGLPIDRRRWRDIVPFVLLGLAAGLFTMRWEEVHQGTGGSDLALGAVDRLLIASRALWFYLGKLLWPSQLSFVYAQWQIDASDPRQYIWVLACVLAAFSLWRWRERLGRGTLAAAAFFVATLSPLLGFFSLFTFHYTYVMDHYQYVASVGPIALAAGGCQLLSNRLAGSWRAPASLCVAATVLGTLGALTWRQCHVYENAEVLWRDTLKKNPECWMAYNNLASGRLLDGRYAEAIPLLRESLRIKPDHHKALSNLGLAEIQSGRLSEAVGHLRRAIELEPRRPEYYNNLGNALLGLGKIEEAIGQYRRAVELAPHYRDALWNLSSALARSGRGEEAREVREKYVELGDREREILGRQ